MSFIIRATGDLGEAIRHAVHVELVRTLANLTLPAEQMNEGVHEARKSFKRLRALYRLIAAADRPAAAVEIARFREAAASLAEAREAAALVEALARLESDFPEAAGDGTLAPLRAFLEARRDAATANGAVPAIAAAIAACRAGLAAIDAFPLPEGRRAGERLIAGGMAATLRKARRALRSARRKGDAEDFHTLRKRIKDHLYHLGLLREVWPRPGSQRRRAVDELGERLGDLNDCAVLAATLEAEAPELCATAAGRAALALIDVQAAALRAVVLAEAKRLLRRRPAAVARRVRRNLRRARGGEA